MSQDEARTFEFTITIKKRVTFRPEDLAAWHASTVEEAVENEKRWLAGKDGQGSYLIMALDGEYDSDEVHALEVVTDV